MSDGKNVRGWAIVFVSFLILMLIFATCVSCMGAYMKPVTEDLGISRTSFSLMTTIQAFAMMLSAMAAGKLMERYNIKILMLAGVALCSGCMFVYAFAPTIEYFYVVSVFMGVSISFTCNIPVSILIKNWFRMGNEGLALGIAFVGSGAGAMVLNPVYTYLIEAFGWRHSFALAGGCIFVVLVPLILFVVAGKPGDFGQEEGRAGMEDGRENVEKDGKEVGWLSGGNAKRDLTVSEAVKRPQTWLVFFAYAILTFAGMGLLQHGIPYMTDCGMSAEKAAFIISLASGVLIFGKILAGGLYDRFGVYKMNLVETGLLILCFCAFWVSGLADLPALLILFAVFYGLGMPFATISMQLVLPYMYGAGNFASIMGMFSISNGIGGMLQIIISIIYDSAGSYYPAWILLTALCLILLFIFAICVKPLKK